MIRIKQVRQTIHKTGTVRPLALAVCTTCTLWMSPAPVSRVLIVLMAFQITPVLVSAMAQMLKLTSVQNAATEKNWRHCHDTCGDCAHKLTRNGNVWPRPTAAWIMRTMIAVISTMTGSTATTNTVCTTKWPAATGALGCKFFDVCISLCNLLKSESSTTISKTCWT